MSHQTLPLDPPYKRWRYPPGCPDGDWCSGNGCCYWDCQADPDADLDRDLAIIRQCIERKS